MNSIILGLGVSTIVIISTYLYLSKPPREYATCKQELERLMCSLEQGMAQDIDEYYAGYQEYTKEDRTYKLNYFQEELLKELIKLDDVDLTVIQDQERKLELKQLRKDAIKRIQGLLKGLDEFRGKL